MKRTHYIYIHYKYKINDKGDKVVVRLNTLISVGLKFYSQGERTEISTYWDMPVISFIIFAVVLCGGAFFLNVCVGLLLGLMVAIAYEVPTRIMQRKLFREIEALVKKEEQANLAADDDVTVADIQDGEDKPKTKATIAAKKASAPLPPKTVTIQCPRCEKYLKIQYRGKGQSIKCPMCGLKGEL